MIDWRKICAGVRDLQFDGDAVLVTIVGGFQQRVEVEPKHDAIELRAIVARRGVVEGLDIPALAMWRRNRASTLVGFRLDNRGRLVGESWVPIAGLTPDEFLVYVRNIAAACDRFEFQLTGKDRE